MMVCQCLEKGFLLKLEGGDRVKDKSPNTEMEVEPKPVEVKLEPPVKSEMEVEAEVEDAFRLPCRLALRSSRRGVKKKKVCTAENGLAK